MKFASYMINCVWGRWFRSVTSDLSTDVFHIIAAIIGFLPKMPSWRSVGMELKQTLKDTKIDALLF